MAAKKSAVKAEKPLDWGRLKHGRGSARLVPELVAKLRGVDPRDLGLDALREALVVKGQAFTASAPAMLLLLDVAEDLAKADATTKAQFLVAAKKYSGKAPSLEAFFANEAKELEEDADAVVVERWHIKRKGEKKPAYEMWTFLVDNGTVFEAGSAKPSGVQMIQGSFAAEKKDPRLHELAGELQRVVPF